MSDTLCGSYEYLKTVKVRDGKKLTSIPNKKHFQSALKKLEMSECKGSVSPKLDKACIDGDNEELSEEQTSRFRSSVLTLMYLSNERTDIQSTVRLLLQEVLMFVGLRHYEIEIKVDSSAVHAFFHRRGVGRMKHIDSRILWLQDLIAAGGVRV